MKKKILVTGSTGQLGQSLQQLAPLLEDRYEWLFVDRQVFPLDNLAEIDAYLRLHQPAAILNCAAYTAVDKAESEPELAMQINAEAPAAMAAWCNESGATLIHYSTDYVFDGTSIVPLKEDAPTQPINVYGSSKRAGEEAVLKLSPSAIIIRTSWVYSPFGANFVKTMLRLMSSKTEISVVQDQVGAPTYALDLAKASISIIEELDKSSDKTSLGGIYHYCNEGRISWFDFATAIQQKSNSACLVHPIPSVSYPTPAKRPAYSLLDCTRITQEFNLKLIPWENSLDDCLLALGQYIA